MPLRMSEYFTNVFFATRLAVSFLYDFQFIDGLI
jgi:hypothetical protein